MKMLKKLTMTREAEQARWNWNIRQDKATGEWICPGSEMTLREAGLGTIEEYIERRKNTVIKYDCAGEIYLSEIRRM
jgi:hypothetical protein